MRELENEVALLKEKLNSSKQEGKDIDDVKGELNVSLNISNNIILKIIATSDKELEPVQHEREGEENNTPKEEDGKMKEYRIIYIIYMKISVILYV